MWTTLVQTLYLERLNHWPLQNRSSSPPTIWTIQCLRSVSFTCKDSLLVRLQKCSKIMYFLLCTTFFSWTVHVYQLKDIMSKYLSRISASILKNTLLKIYCAKYIPWLLAHQYEFFGRNMMISPNHQYIHFAFQNDSRRFHQHTWMPSQWSNWPWIHQHRHQEWWYSTRFPKKQCQPGIVQ